MTSKRKQYTGEEKLEGREDKIFAARNRKLTEAREARARRRESVHSKRFSGPLPMAQTWAPHVRCSVLFTRGEIPVHAEPIHGRTPSACCAPLRVRDGQRHVEAICSGNRSFPNVT